MSTTKTSTDGLTAEQLQEHYNTAHGHSELRKRFGAHEDETLKEACERFVQDNKEMHQSPLSMWIAANAIASMGLSGQQIAASMLGIKPRQMGGGDAG